MSTPNGYDRRRPTVDRPNGDSAGAPPMRRDASRDPREQALRMNLPDPRDRDRYAAAGPGGGADPRDRERDRDRGDRDGTRGGPTPPNGRDRPRGDYSDRERGERGGERDRDRERGERPDRDPRDRYDRGAPPPGVDGAVPSSSSSRDRAGGRDRMDRDREREAARIAGGSGGGDPRERRPDYRERSDRDRADGRPDRSDRPDRPDRGDASRPDRPERTERERADRERERERLGPDKDRPPPDRNRDPRGDPRDRDKYRERPRGEDGRERERDPRRDRERDAERRDTERRREGDPRNPDPRARRDPRTDPRADPRSDPTKPTGANITNLLAQIGDFDFGADEASSQPLPPPPSKSPTTDPAMKSDVKITARGSSRNKMEDTPVVIPERRRRPTNDRDMIRNATDRLAVDRGDPPPPLEPDLLQPNPITRSPTSVSSPKLLSRTGTTATNVSGSSRTATPQTTTRTQPPTTLSRRNSTDSTASAETDLSKSRQQSRRDGSRSERGAPTPLREKIAGRSTSPGSNLDGSETSRSTRPTDPPIRSPLRDRSKSRERSRSNDLARDDANRKHMSGLTVNSTSSILEQADPSTLSTMLGDALQESKTYTIYTQERFEEKKKEFAVLSSQVASLQNRLTLESRIREAALALTKTNTDKAQSRTAQEQLATANRKVDAIATDLWKVTGKLMEVERVVLKHTAGVLRWGAAANKEEGGLEKGGTAELKSAESKIRESEREISVLKSTVLRLEGEGEPLRRDLENARRLLDQEREERARSERNFERRLKEMEVGRAGSPGSSDVNRLKLEVATLKAELSTTQEDFANVNDKLLGMQKQLDEDLGVMESKDRMISELLAELEEATNQLEMREKAAAAAVAASGEGASVVERRLREQVVALEERVRSGERSPGSMSGRTARNSVMVREQVQMQTEGLRTTLGGQLKEAMGEKERVVGLLEAEKRRVRELEEKLRKAESDTEDDEGGSTRYGSRKGSRKDAGSVSGVNDEDMRSLKRLWVELPEVLSPKNRTPPVSPGGRGETFSVGELVVRVTKIVGERREMQRRLEGIEGELREARSEVSTSMKDMKMLDGREKELKNDLRNLERSNERLESELMHLKKQVKDAEIMNSTSSSSATRKLEEIQATHTREMTRLTEKHERALRDVERDLGDGFDRKMRDAEREWVLNQDRKLRELERELTRKHEVECDDLKRKIESEIGNARKLKIDLEGRETEMGRLERERDDLLNRLTEMENVFRSQAMEIEMAQKAELEALRETHDRELKDMVSSEREKSERFIEDLEREVTDLRQRLEDVRRSNDLELRRQIQEVEDKAADDLRRRLETSEQLFREQLMEVQQAHDEEKEQTEVAHREEIARLRDQNNRDKQRELTDLRSQLESSSKNLESDLLSRLDRETETLRNTHSSALDSLRARHDEDLQRLRDDHREEIDQMQNRLSRSEAALVTSKSQFFQDRERLQESIDDLERQVRNYKQQELEASGTFSTKAREYEAAIDRLKYDVQAAQTLAEQMRDDTDRKQREIALLEQKHRQQMQALQTECDDRVRELEQHLEDFEAVRGELESVERDYMAELSKHDTERLQAERALAESKEAQNMLRQQLDVLQRKLDEAQREVHEARSSAAPRVTDRATEKALQGEIERMQETIVGLKTAKNELLEELDDQAIRVQSMQAELDGMRKDHDKVRRGNMDWDAERRRYETLMTAQREEISNLQVRLQDLAVDKLGGSSLSSEPPSTQKLRTEFRKMVADLRSEYAGQVSREANLRSQLEVQLRAAQRDRDEDLYNKTNIGTQTNLRWLAGEQPQRLHYA